jgi:hypothetical protein
MNYTKLFYWLSVADNAKTMFVVFVSLFTAISVISTIWFIVDRNGNDLSCADNKSAERAKKWMWWSYPFMILFWSLYVLTPSKKDALLIVAGGQTMNFLTTDSTAKQIPHDVLNFVSVELKNMAKESQVDLGIASQKDKVLEEAKAMTSQQLLEKMQMDTTFAKIILDK